MVKFLREIIKAKDLSSYGLARLIDIPTQSIDHALSTGRSLAISTLVKLRYVSGFSWSKFGKMLDDEYLSDVDKQRIDTTEIKGRPLQRKGGR